MARTCCSWTIPSVRGTTSGQIIQQARDAGARRVYFASAAPPVRYQNVYGIDMPVTGELVAFNRSEEDVAEVIGADRLIYQSLDGLVDAVRRGNPRLKEFDTSCFTGEYVTGGVSSSYLEQIARAPRGRSPERQSRGGSRCRGAASSSLTLRYDSRPSSPAAIVPAGGGARDSTRDTGYSALQRRFDASACGRSINAAKAKASPPKLSLKRVFCRPDGGSAQGVSGMNEFDASESGFDTLSVRAGQVRTGEQEHNDPIFLTSSFVFTNAREAAARLRRRGARQRLLAVHQPHRARIREPAGRAGGRCRLPSPLPPACPRS